MNIILYSISAKKNQLSKTLPAGTTLTGTLRTPVSLTDPEILIESSSVPSYNYAYISDFGRYFFIESVICEQLNLFRLRMHVDVLMTYKGVKDGGSSTGIYGLAPYVERQESSPMDDLPETMIPVTSTTELTLSATATNANWAGSSKLLTSSDTIERYYLWINARIGVNALGTWTYRKTPLALTVLGMGYYGQRNLAESLQAVRTTSDGRTLLDYVYRFGALPIKLASSTALNTPYQLDLPSAFSNSDIYLPTADSNTNDTKFSLIESESLKPQSVDFTVTVNVPSIIRPTRNFPPYTRLSLVFRPFGKFEIDPGLIYRNASSSTTTFKVRVTVDPVSGTGYLFYGKSSPDIYLGSANLFISYPLSAQSYSGAKIASGVLSIAGSVASAVMTNGATAASIPASIINAASASIPNTSIQGGETFFIDEGPHVEMYQKTSEDFADNYFGRPFYATANIYSLSGYTQVGKVKIYGTGFSTILDDERSELEAIMKGGFYI